MLYLNNFYSPDDIPTPKTREEHYLAKMAGADVDTPEPKTRQEHYLKEIAENGSGGVFFVPFTGSENAPSTNISLEEIVAASANKQVIATFKDSNNVTWFLTLMYIAQTDNEEPRISFSKRMEYDSREHAWVWSSI